MGAEPFFEEVLVWDYKEGGYDTHHVYGFAVSKKGTVLAFTEGPRALGSACQGGRPRARGVLQATRRGSRREREREGMSSVFRRAHQIEIVDAEQPGSGVSVFIGVDPKTPPTLGYSTTLPDSGF